MKREEKGLFSNFNLKQKYESFDLKESNLNSELVISKRFLQNESEKTYAIMC